MQETNPQKTPVKIGIALSGGGARAVAHLGVLQVLEEHKIPISIISGTSMGALIGGAYAAGATLEQIEAVTRDIGAHKLVGWSNFSLLREAVFKPEKFEAHWKPLVGDMLIQNAKIPFIAIATDLEAGHEVDLREGPLLKALMASAAYPTIFPPVFMNERYLMDGGILNNIPVDIIRPEAQVVIGVDIESHNTRQFISGMAYDKYYRKLSGWRKWLNWRHWFTTQWKLNLLLMSNIVIQTIGIAREETIQRKVREGRPDLLVSPDVDNFSFFGFRDADAIIAEGRKAMEAKIPRLKEIIQEQEENMAKIQALKELQ